MNVSSAFECSWSCYMHWFYYLRFQGFSSCFLTVLTKTNALISIVALKRKSSGKNSLDRSKFYSRTKGMPPFLSLPLSNGPDIFTQHTADICRVKCWMHLTRIHSTMSRKDVLCWVKVGWSLIPTKHYSNKDPTFLLFSTRRVSFGLVWQSHTTKVLGEHAYYKGWILWNEAGLFTRPHAVWITSTITGLQVVINF